MLSCPLCDGSIDLEEEDLTEGDVISCDECGASLNVTNTNPLEISAEDEEEEDEEDILDDDDEDDDLDEDDDDDEEW